MWPFKKKKVEELKIDKSAFGGPNGNNIWVAVDKDGKPLISVAEEKKEKFSITIFFRDSSQLGYSQVYKPNSGKTAIGIFMDFYRWFYERESPAYTFTHKLGGDIIIRSEITKVSFRKEEIEEKQNAE